MSRPCSGSAKKPHRPSACDGQVTGRAVNGRSQIFVDDLLRSLRALQIDSVPTAREVMRMLSLEDWHEIAASRLPIAEAKGAAGPVSAELDDPLAAAEAVAAASRPTAAALPPERAEPELLVIRREEAPAVRPRPPWVDQVVPLARAARATSPQPDALFDPRQERALLGGLSACMSHDGDLDVQRLLQDLTGGAPLRELPLQRSWSSRRGLQLLIDDGPGMAPFRADVERLWARLGELLPADRLTRLAFQGCPTRGCRVPRRKGSRPWVPPDSAVLVVTDLGIAAAEPSSGPCRPAEWLAFCAMAEAAGVQLRSLIPYPAHRWPVALVGRLHPVAWDRSTSAATVRRAVAAAAQLRLA